MADLTLLRGALDAIRAENISDAITHIERYLADDEHKMSVITLVINEEDFEREEGQQFTDADLVSFGKEANDMAAHWLGYEGWIAKRGERYVFDPDETITGA